MGGRRPGNRSRRALAGREEPQHTPPQQKVAKRVPAGDGISIRERLFLRFWIEGNSIAKAARMAGYSPTTARSYIYRKLRSAGLSSRY